MKKINVLILLYHPARVAACLFGVAVFLLCLSVNACQKSIEKPGQSRGVLLPSDNLAYVPDIPETVETEPDEVTESDPIDYNPEAVTATKITNVLAVKDTFTHGTCNPATNKYKDYIIAGGDGYQIILTLSKPDTIVSIVNPSGYYYLSVIQEESSSTQVTVMHVDLSLIQPDYKARNIKWVVTFKNGKKTNLYMKTIPYFGLTHTYGSPSYHVNYIRWLTDKSKFNMGQSMGIAQAIPSNWTPTILDIIHYGNAHWGVIAAPPVQKITRVNGVNKTVWVLKIKERNASCDWKATTKTFKWYPGLKIPSANTARDSAHLYYRSY